MTLSRPGFGNSELRKDKSVIDDTMSALRFITIWAKALHLVGHTLTGLAIALCPSQPAESQSLSPSVLSQCTIEVGKHLPLVQHFLDLAHRAPWACLLAGQRILRGKRGLVSEPGIRHSVPDRKY